MFLSRNKKEENKTNFFDGINLIKTLLSSTFGLFHKTIKNLDIPTDNFKLPSIIIIGNESSGKSSLIQNILKCNIFPTDRRTCTKMPIKLDLINSNEEKYLIIYKNETIIVKNKEDILIKVTKIMNDIGENKIVEDEINIQFYHPEVINNTFYDLPGIREFPEDLRVQTKNITNKYINIPNTLIICVIPASVTRLTSNQTLGMVIDANKCQNCIIALSMVDLLHEDDHEELLVNRLLNTNDELKNINIHKIIGIINKDKNEDEWFKKNIINYLKDSKIKEHIKQQVTLRQLLVNLDNLYHNYIRDNWKHQGLSEINNNISKLELEYKNLGNENLTCELVINYVLALIDFNSIGNEIINDETHPFTRIYKLYPEGLDYTRYPEYYDININMFKDYYNTIKNDIIIKINKKIEEIFTNPEEESYNLCRFEIFYEMLLETIKNIINKKYIKIDEWFENKVEYLDYNCDSSTNWNTLRSNIYINIKRHILLKIKDNILEGFKFTFHSYLEESEEYKEKRKYLKTQLEKYNKSKEVITDIENYIK